MDRSEEKWIKKLEEMLKEKLEESYPGRSGRAVEYDVFMAAVEKVSSMEIQYSEDAVYGCYSRPDQRIVIGRDLDEKEKMKAAIHGAAYALCAERERGDNLREKKRWTVKRLEGAAVEYMACEYFGLGQRDDFARNIISDHIESWGMGMDRTELLSSMEFIRKMAGELIEGIEEKIQGRRREVTAGEYRADDLDDLQMLLHKSGEAKEADNQEEGKDSTFSYYVVNDVSGQKETGSYRYFDDLALAFIAYAALPNHLDKQIGMVDPEREEDKIFLVNCRNGWDEVIDLDKEGIPGRKWICEETTEALWISSLYVYNHETEIAYKAGKGYFTIQTDPDGYDYTVYDQNFKEVDSGIFDHPDVSVRDAMTEIFASDGIRAEECRVIPYGEFQENVKNAAKEETRKEKKETGEKILPESEQGAEVRKESTGINKKRSVLSELREHQSKLRGQEKEKGKRVENVNKKGILR